MATLISPGMAAMKRFEGRLFLITGAARGLGAAQAQRLVAEGARVVRADVREAEGRALALSLGPAACFEPLDVGDEARWAEVVAAAERLGPLHGLVNNAGIFKPLPIAQTDAELYNQHVRVNQLGTYLGIRTVVPAFERTGGGVIVNLSSAAGLIGVPNAVAYTATKWAVRGMTKAAAKELGPRNIRVNSVHPGMIDTEMVRERDAAVNQALVNQQPIKRMGTADEIAGLVLFVLSDEARYMTGAELAMDGGRTL
jgi:3alpha(or 20beta)-hydroxysteroid dehydrogenase